MGWILPGCRRLALHLQLLSTLSKQFKCEACFPVAINMKPLLSPCPLYFVFQKHSTRAVPPTGSLCHTHTRTCTHTHTHTDHTHTDHTHTDATHTHTHARTHARTHAYTTQHNTTQHNTAHSVDVFLECGVRRI